MKRILVLALVVMLLLSAVGCGKKLVSDTCAICGEAAKKNYVNGDVAFDADMGGYPALHVEADETIALCETHFMLVEYAAGASK